MQFLADESCDFAVVKALRSAGHDVSAIAELSPGAEDDVVLARARSEARVLFTRIIDKTEAPPDRSGFYYRLKG